MANVDYLDARLATKLLDAIAPGSQVIRGSIAAGEEILAVMTLLEVAVEHRQAVSVELLDAVQDLVDDEAFDADDAVGVIDDLSTLRSLEPTRSDS